MSKASFVGDLGCRAHGDFSAGPGWDALFRKRGRGVGGKEWNRLRGTAPRRARARRWSEALGVQISGVKILPAGREPQRATRARW